jgi:hypothetical protein
MTHISKNQVLVGATGWSPVDTPNKIQPLATVVSIELDDPGKTKLAIKFPRKLRFLRELSSCKNSANEPGYLGQAKLAIKFI